MKTRFSKKLISLLLSLLMVVSTLPMTAIIAFAAPTALSSSNLDANLFGQYLVSSDMGTNAKTAYNYSFTQGNATNTVKWTSKNGQYQYADFDGNGYLKYEFTKGTDNLLYKIMNYAGTSNSVGYPFTISFMLQSDYDQSSSTEAGIFGIGTDTNFFSASRGSNTSGNARFFGYTTKNTFDFSASWGNFSPAVGDNFAASSDGWCYYTLSFQPRNTGSDDGTLRVFKNGVQIAKFVDNRPIDRNLLEYNSSNGGSAKRIGIGADFVSGTSAFKGRMRDFRFYSNYINENDNTTAAAIMNSQKEYAELTKGGKPQDGTLSKTASGLYRCNGTTSRLYDTYKFNIVNDQQKDNTSAGIIEYNISSIKGKNVDNATLNYKVTSFDTDSATNGLVVYYTTSSSLANYVNATGNIESKSPNNSYGSGTTANNAFASELGFSTSDIFGYIPYGTTSASTMNIKDALQKALDTNKDKLYIIIMHKNAGGESGTPWSDTKVDPALFTISYTVREKSYTRTEVATVKTKLTAKTFSNYPYSGTMTSTQDGSYSKSTLVGGDEMLNVLYSYGVSTGSNNYKDWGDNNYYQPGMQFGDATLLWDGVNKMAVPINVYGTRTTAWTGNGASELHSLYIRGNGYSDNSVVYLNHNWHTSSYNDSNAAAGGYQGTKCYASYLNSDTHIGGSRNSTEVFRNNKDQTAYYSNTLYVDGSKLTFGDNKRTTLSMYGKMYYYGNGGERTKEKSGSDFTQASIRVINYAPIADAIRKGKEIYATVSNDEYSYCPTDLYNFYNALDKLMSFNPNNYFAYNNNGYAACCEAMAALDDYISPASTALTKSNLSYNHTYTDGEIKNAQKHIIHCNDCGEDIEEACSFTLTSTVDSTCSATGTKTYTCSKCQGTVTEIIEKKAHDWGEWNPNMSSTYHYRQCKNCTGDDSWDKAEHDRNTTLPAEEATVGTPGKTTGTACSVCGRVMDTQTETRVDQSAYNSAVTTANAALDNKDQYTAKSIAALQKALDDNQKANEDTQTTLDAKATAIQTATQALVVNSFNVTFKVIKNEVTYEVKKLNGVRYGTVVTFDAATDAADYISADSYIFKWTAHDTKGDSNIGSSSNTVSYVAYDETTIYCFVTEKAAQAEKTVKVTLKDKSGHITGIAYVAAGSTFTKEANVLKVDGNDLTAPKYPFYQIKDFCLEGSNTIITDNGYAVTEDIVVRPVYSAESRIDITTVANDVTINGKVTTLYEAKWDQTITVSNPSATAWYANGVLVATGNTYKFQATQSVEITYDTATVTEGKSRIDYAKYEGQFGYSRIVVSNCVPEGATVVEQGIKILTSSKENVPSVASSKVIAGTKKFTASKVTDTGLQFMFTLSTDEAVKTIAVVSFVTYELGGQTYTVWSSEGDDSATMIYKA